MITTSEFCKREYGEKLYKISFDAGFTCPNRDGKAGSRGCIFCSEGGSGDFAVRLHSPLRDENGPLRDENSPLREENGPLREKSRECDEFETAIERAKKRVAKKYKGSRYIAYFQAYTGTYADAVTLREIYLPVIKRDDVAVLSIATRPDCLNEEVYALLKELSAIKPVWVELGLQTVKEESVRYIRRGYDTAVYDEAVRRLNLIGIHTITHVILYLPGESVEDMLGTVRHSVMAGTKGIKLQLLHVLKGTDLAPEYGRTGFYIPTLEEYCLTVKKCIEACPDDMVFHRLTGDPPKSLLIEPKWSADKKRVLNTLSHVLGGL